MRMRQNRTGETGSKLKSEKTWGAGGRRGLERERDLVGINQEGFPGMKGRLQGQLLITRCHAIDTVYVICWETSEHIAKEWQKKQHYVYVMFQDVDTGYYGIHNVRPKLQKCYKLRYTSYVFRSASLEVKQPRQSGSAICFSGRRTLHSLIKCP